jgi:putative heme iron utilization protein
MDGRMTYSIQFFDCDGRAAIKVFLSFGEAASPEIQSLFRTIKEDFGQTVGTHHDS